MRRRSVSGEGVAGYRHTVRCERPGQRILDLNIDQTHVYFLSEAIRELGNRKEEKEDLIGFTQKERNHVN